MKNQAINQDAPAHSSQPNLVMEIVTKNIQETKFESDPKKSGLITGPAKSEFSIEISSQGSYLHINDKSPRNSRNRTGSAALSE